MAIQRVNKLLDVLHGREKPYFNISYEEWENFQGSTVMKVAVDDLERQRKTLKNIMKSALMQLPQ